MNPRLLLLEDDGVSAAFLVQVLSALPATVEHAASVTSARVLASPGQHLWLFDAHLPDGHGGELLRALRAQGWRTPAIALTADPDPRALQRLRDDGFLQVLAKPLDSATLLAAVRLQLRAVLPRQPWDDAAARLALGGDDVAVQALRRMFLDELPGQGRAVVDACVGGDALEARQHLHRLKASCGFVGATDLLEAVRALSASPDDAAALSRFQACAGELLDTA